MNSTHRERGARHARNDIERYGLEYTARLCSRFEFTLPDLMDGGFSYAAAYIATVASYGGPL